MGAKLLTDILNIILNNWKLPKRPSIREVMKCYANMKKNDVDLYLPTRKGVHYGG